MSVFVEKVWTKIGPKVLNNVKVFLLKYYVKDIIDFFAPRILIVVKKYAKYLPNFVVDSEIDDLSTIAQLEFLETLKVWEPEQNINIWPLAQARIQGAMKDHIRYITRSDPSRYYDWVVDAAYVYNTIQTRADFVSEIENGIHLNQILKCLTLREKKIIVAHTRRDLTFKEIGKKLGVSESQISRIYKKSIEKVRKAVEKES